MKEKLELKHLAPYLPYGLKIFDVYDNNIKILYTASLSVTNSVQLYKTHIKFLHSRILEEIKPILRHLSDLTKDIDHNGEKFVPLDIIEQDQEIDYLADCGIWTQKLLEEQRVLCIELIPYGIIQQLFEWQFDVFGLIDKGLAIDINTLK